MDYTDLVRKLRSRRICVQSGGDLEQDFPLMREAADAIEYLSTFESAFRSIVEIGGWWLVGNDGNIYSMNVPMNWPPKGTKTVELFPLPQPPKEEQNELR